MRTVCVSVVANEHVVVAVAKGGRSEWVTFDVVTLLGIGWACSLQIVCIDLACSLRIQYSYRMMLYSSSILSFDQQLYYVYNHQVYLSSCS